MDDREKLCKERQIAKLEADMEQILFNYSSKQDARTS